MKILVGHTGFVGSNLLEAADFDACYNSKNIADAYGSKPDVLVYAGVPAAKFLANTNPDADMMSIRQAENNISRIAPKKLILISTIDVFSNPVNVDENAEILLDGLHPYGKNRYILEQWAREEYTDALIVRLPALFGKNLKKNFLYDMLHPVPRMLSIEKFQELAAAAPALNQYYELAGNFYKKKAEGEEALDDGLKKIFAELCFSALNFTDSRNIYQFYPLSRLWHDIKYIWQEGIRLFHPATEPVMAAEIYRYVTGREFSNICNNTPVLYDYRTKYGELFGRDDGYIMSKAEILAQIRLFFHSEGLDLL